MAHIDFTQLTWFVPKPRTSLAITIPNLEALNLNQYLWAQMPSRITLGISQSGEQICIRETDDTGYKLPKSGSAKDKDLVRRITDAGVRLPARYTVYKEDGYWLAVLDEQPAFKVDLHKPPRNRRSNSLHCFAKEVESL